MGADPRAARARVGRRARAAPAAPTGPPSGPRRARRRRARPRRPGGARRRRRGSSWSCRRRRSRPAPRPAPGEVEAELLARLPRGAVLGRLPAPQPAAGELPQLAVAVRVPDEQDLPVAPAQDDLDPAGVRARDGPPGPQPQVRQAEGGVGGARHDGQATVHGHGRAGPRGPRRRPRDPRGLRADLRRPLPGRAALQRRGAARLRRPDRALAPRRARRRDARQGRAPARAPGGRGRALPTAVAVDLRVARLPPDVAPA